MKIITLTLNPAFDVHCFCKSFRPYHESIATVTAKDAGGKGVNISRALYANGNTSRAVVIVGKENGTEFCQALERDGLSVSAVWVDGRIRENITLHESENPETRISFEGFACKEGVLRKVKELIGEVDESTVVTFTGSIPKGIAVTDALALLKELKEKGAKIVIDSRSVSLEQLLSFGPWLIKPNKDEAEAYLSRKISGVDDAAAIARELYESGVSNVMVSLGGDGAVLANGEGAFYAKSPDIPVLSTIGAGDSTIAGFIDGVSLGLTTENALKRAIAFGTAACLTEGTMPPDGAEVSRLVGEVSVKRL